MGGQFNKFKLQDFTTLNTCYLLHIKCVLCIVQWHTKKSNRNEAGSTYYERRDAMYTENVVTKGAIQGSFLKYSENLFISSDEANSAFKE